MTNLGPLGKRCPTCQAKPGERCVGLTTRAPMMSTFHSRRELTDYKPSWHGTDKPRRKPRRRKDTT